MHYSPYSYTLVLLQGFCLIYLIGTTPFYTLHTLSIYLLGVAAALIVWSIWELRKTRFSIMPDVAPRATLVTTGPYAYVRHPIYTALILAALALSIAYYSPTRIFVGAVLCVVLVYKSRYEEILLIKKFPDYKTYKKRVKALVPYIL